MAQILQQDHFTNVTDRQDKRIVQHVRILWSVSHVSSFSLEKYTPYSRPVYRPSCLAAILDAIVKLFDLDNPDTIPDGPVKCQHYWPMHLWKKLSTHIWTNVWMDKDMGQSLDPLDLKTNESQ